MYVFEHSGPKKPAIVSYILHMSVNGKGARFIELAFVVPVPPGATVVVNEK